jgi:hypothetical protein
MSRLRSLQEREIVRDFLQLVKETIANPVADQGWVLVPRKENKECILKLGFKYPDIQETLLGLSVEDYCEGPRKDRDQPGELWVFGKAIENKVVYIKLKLASFGPLRIVRVVSFHLAEHILEYPFKEKGGDRDDEND